MSYLQKQRLHVILYVAGNILAIVTFIYIVFLGLWKAVYPTCIAFYAPAIFRALDADSCNYDWPK
jgi:uncharacterized membrane protein